MGAYEHIKKTFVKEYKKRSLIYKQRLAKFRGEDAIVPADRPTNLPRARQLGYKAKQGYVIVRVRMSRGQRKRPEPSGGRKPGKNVRYLSPGMSLQRQAEQRAARKYMNLEVLNSYWVGQDGQKKYFEVILVDPVINPKLDLVKKRVFRGMTSAGRKGRGL